MDRTLFEGKFISVIERDGWYEFMHPTDSGGIVYVLVYRGKGKAPILGRYEVCPAHGDKEPTLTSITGQVPLGRTPAAIAVMEVEEEAGYTIAESQLIRLGEVRLSKAADTTAYLYAVDVMDMERGEAPGDGSFGEKGSYCEWVTVEEAINCKCPVVASMMLRLKGCIECT